MPIPKALSEIGLEDIENIQKDISGLFDRFIRPIDNIRSMAKPVGSATSLAANFNDIQVNNNRPLESRCAAFYRMLGFPVAEPNGTFYNPGFDPYSKNNNKKFNINEKYKNSDLVSLTKKREELPEYFRSVFTRQDFNGSIFSLLLKHNKKFNNMESGLGPFESDQQAYSVDAREDEIKIFQALNPGLTEQISSASAFFSSSLVGANLAGGKHPLKPFVVDPFIDITVMPDINKICVPFLPNKAATKIGPNIYLSRPGLELVIRERLKLPTDQVSFLTTINQIVADGLTTDEAITIGAISDSFRDLTVASNLSEAQFRNVNQLIKIMRAVIARLYTARFEIEEAQNKINWLPIPAISGPEAGANGASLNTSLINKQSEINRKIIELRIKKLNAEKQETTENDLGDFASPFAMAVGGENINQYDSELKQEIGKRDRIANKAFKAMQDIEIITGETTGLGLIDILAIYTALWAIDIETLLGFLDETAFNRLVNNNPELVTDEVRNLSSSRPSLISTLADFEKTLANILNFADLLASNKSITLSDLVKNISL